MDGNFLEQETSIGHIAFGFCLGLFILILLINFPGDINDLKLFYESDSPNSTEEEDKAQDISKGPPERKKREEASMHEEFRERGVNFNKISKLVEEINEIDKDSVFIRGESFSVRDTVN
eukprot:maker-scaffold_33-snap-gene-0.0-mRNA-1 protein AED:0.37 eAED:0.37 QI:59/0.5/0.33/1/1/1/3/0/118